ncbi:MAG: hypothetical protein R3B57_02325 [Phycisphaerales bacterium]
MIVTYDGEPLRIPVQIPQPLPLPGLARHADWLRIVSFAEGTGMGFPEFERRFDAGEITPRLVVVTRNPFADQGDEPKFGLETDKSWGWGEVRRDKWTFTFYELLPEGGFASHTLKFPESGAHFYRRQIDAERKGLPPPVRDPDELKEGTWEFQATLPLMNRPPSITKERQALRESGWTLPTASASIIGIIACLAIALAPSREQVERRVAAQESRAAG